MEKDDANALISAATAVPPAIVSETRRVVLVAVLVTIAIQSALVASILTFFVNADFVDTRLKLSSTIAEKLSLDLVRKVDPGYSRTFVFRPDDPTADNELLFQAEDDQLVTFYVFSKTSEPEKVTLKISLDNRPWEDGQGDFHTMATNAFKVNCDHVHGCLHTAKVVVLMPKNHLPVVVEFLILVSNPPLKDSHKK